VAELVRGSGTQFDPDVVRTFTHLPDWVRPSHARRPVGRRPCVWPGSNLRQGYGGTSRRAGPTLRCRRRVVGPVLVVAPVLRTRPSSDRAPASRPR
jgi:hypothetical protein